MGVLFAFCSGVLGACLVFSLFVVNAFALDQIELVMGGLAISTLTIAVLILLREMFWE